VHLFFRIVPLFTYSEPVFTVVCLRPPTIHYTEINHTVDGCLHAAGPAGLLGPPGIIEPNIHAPYQIPGHVNVVILQENNLPPESIQIGYINHPFYQLLPWPVGRMGLTGKYNLYGLFGVVHQIGQSVQVPENNQCPLVCGESTGKAYGKSFGIEIAVHLVHPIPGLKISHSLNPQVISGEINQFAF